MISTISSDYDKWPSFIVLNIEERFSAIKPNFAAVGPISDPNLSRGIEFNLRPVPQC